LSDKKVVFAKISGGTFPLNQMRETGDLARYCGETLICFFSLPVKPSENTKARLTPVYLAQSAKLFGKK
jgi:hypothetical protein